MKEKINKFLDFIFWGITILAVLYLVIKDFNEPLRYFLLDAIGLFTGLIILYLFMLPMRSKEIK
jgi:magnesium-transporting ATPase (P-type)